MRTGISLLAIACALALAACGAEDRPADADPPSDAAIEPVDPAPAGTPAPGAPDVVDSGAPMADEPMAAAPMTDDAAPDATADASAGAADDAGDAAVVSDCSTTIEGNDRIQFNVDSINIPASCSEFTITLEHVGQLPVAAMGHNVVVTASADFAGAAAEGLAAGADAGYVKPDDDRVIAHTDMVGGGESTSVTFSTSSLEQGGDYTFFCSFPGHSALMRGTLTFGG